MNRVNRIGAGILEWIIEGWSGGFGAFGGFIWSHPYAMGQFLSIASRESERGRRRFTHTPGE